MQTAPQTALLQSSSSACSRDGLWRVILFLGIFQSCTHPHLRPWQPMMSHSNNDDFIDAGTFTFSEAYRTYIKHAAQGRKEGSPAASPLKKGSAASPSKLASGKGLVTTLSLYRLPTRMCSRGVLREALYNQPVTSREGSSADDDAMLHYDVIAGRPRGSHAGKRPQAERYRKAGEMHNGPPPESVCAPELPRRSWCWCWREGGSGGGACTIVAGLC